MKNVLPILLLFWSTILFAQMNMNLLSNWNGSTVGYNDVWGYVDDYDNEYAIIGSRTNTYFIDISDLNAPIEIANFDGSFTTPTDTINGASTTWRDFKTFKRFAYGVCDSCGEGLSIYDLTDIHNGNVYKVNQKNDVFTSCHNIYIDVPKGRLYAVGGTMGNRVAVFDLESNPTDPVLLANVLVDGGYIHDIFVQDHIAYGSSGYDGMYIIDMTDPANPITKASLSTNGYNHSNWIYDNGTKLLVAEEVPQGLPLMIMDIADKDNDNIFPINTFHEPLEAPMDSSVTYHNPYVIDNYGIVSSYNDGITIFDLSNPMDTNLVAYYDTYSSNVGDYNGYNGCWGSYPFLPSGAILGSDRSTGLYVLETSVNLTTDCYDGLQNEFERGIDCGGFCKPCATCNDGILNGDETGIDCGGSTCNPCAPCPTNEILTGTESDSVYYSSNLILSFATIPNGVDVSYNSREIILTQSFEVELGGLFCASTDNPCTPPYTSNPTSINNPTATYTIQDKTNPTDYNVSILQTESVVTIEADVPAQAEQAYILIQDEKNTILEKIKLQRGQYNIHKIDFRAFEKMLHDLKTNSNKKLFVNLFINQTSKSREIER